MTITSNRRRLAARAFAAGALALAAAPAFAGQYRVTLSAMVILPPDTPRAPGSERDLSEGDIVFSAPLGWFHSATLGREVTLEAAGVTETMPAGTLLQAMVSGRGGDLATLPTGTPVFCGELRTNLVSTTASMMTLGLTNLGTRVARQRRFCLVDADKDGAFERTFLVGAKRADDLHMVEIAPVPYEAARNRPIGPGNMVQLRFRVGTIVNNGLFNTEVFVGNTLQPIQSMLTGGDSGRIVSTSAGIAFRTPGRQFQFGPARLTVLAYDSYARRARIRYDRDLALTPVALVHRPQTIYVYVPR